MGSQLIYYIFATLASLIALTIHEYSHALAADRLGDPTPRNAGRLSLSPLKHLDIFGTLSMVLFHIGWAKPVPINPRNLKKPRRDFALTALAGPLSNMLCAFFSALLYLLLYRLFSTVVAPSAFVGNLMVYSLLLVQLFHLISLGLAVFNLIPVPPLDGSRILHLLLPPKLYFKLMQHDRTFYYGLLIWLFAGGAVSRFLLRIAFVQAFPVLRFIATYVISLSNAIGFVIEALSDLMLAFWQLIPGL